MCSLTSQINLQNWHQISSVKYMFMTNLFDLRINGYNIWQVVIFRDTVIQSDFVFKNRESKLKSIVKRFKNKITNNR